MTTNLVPAGREAGSASRYRNRQLPFRKVLTEAPLLTPGSNDLLAVCGDENSVDFRVVDAYEVVPTFAAAAFLSPQIRERLVTRLSSILLDYA